VLVPGGRLCIAVVHPLNSSGRFEGDQPDHDAAFTIRGSYLAAFAYRDDVERNGLRMSFHGQHRPLESYTVGLEQAGFVVEAIREVPSTTRPTNGRKYRCSWT
jgi:hypothetical protein